MKIMNILKGIKSIPKPSLKAAQNKLKDVSHEKSWFATRQRDHFAKSRETKKIERVSKKKK